MGDRDLLGPRGAWPSEQAFTYLTAQRGKHFDPRLVEAFVGMTKEVLEIQNEWRDPPSTI